MELIFRAYAGNTTTALGVLTDATDKRVSVHYNGPGTGSFNISRHSSQFVWCAPGNYVRVYIDSTASTPIFAFFIESGQDDVTSRDEEGGEVVQRGGRGVLAYLERAIIDHTSSTGRYRANDTLWRWNDPTHGQIVKELIDDAKLRGVLPLLTYDFTNSTESGGGTWTAIDGRYELPVGLDLLQALQRQQSAGLVATMSPSFVLSCSEEIGTDMSATITFEAGVNIAEEVTRDVLASAAKSRVLVQGTTEDGDPRFRWVADSDVEAALGDRREGFVSYQATPDGTTLERVGRQAIRRLKRRHDGLSVLGVLTDEFVPFTDYDPGDTVTVNVPGVWANLEAPITSIVLFDSENGDADCALEFEDIAFEALALADRSERDPATGGGGSGGGGNGGGGGGGGAGTDPCCPPPEPWRGLDLLLEAGDFFDYFGRTNAGSWGTPSSSGHAITSGWYVLPGHGAFGPSGYPAAAGGAQYTTTGVPAFTAGEWRLEMDFTFRAYDSPDFPGDTSYLGEDPGLAGFGIGFAFVDCADLPGAMIFADGQYVLAAGVVVDNGSISGLTLTPNTPYTLVFTSNPATNTARLEIAGYSVEIADAANAGDTRNLQIRKTNALAPPDNASVARVTRVQLFEILGQAPPAFGQPVLGESLGAGDGVTVTFITAYPYRPGSLVVRVNGINVTDEVASFDPTGAEFTFTTAPGVGSEITVDYQGMGVF